MKRLIKFVELLVLWFAWMVIIVPAELQAESVIVAVTYRNAAGNIEEQKGTAVAIYSNERGSVLLTCKHVVQDAPESVWIKASGDWHQCRHVQLHPSEDVAVMECPVRLKATALADGVKAGSTVVVDGAGPALHGTDEPWFFTGVALSDGIRNPQGLAVIHGDSGGPVYVKSSTGKYAVGGIAYACACHGPGRKRADHCGHDVITKYTPCSKFIPWIETQYCPNGNCPIQIRRQVIQPVGPLGFPRGPARVIGIAEPVPQQYDPVPRQQSQESIVRPMPDPISVTGPPGATGPQGPRGEPGLSVTQEQVEAVVNAWLDSNRESLRGEPGLNGQPGERGLVGVPDNEDIANWLRGAMSDPASREAIRSQLRDLLAEDPRIQKLLKQIEAGSAPKSVELELIGDGKTTLGSSRITLSGDRVLVESKTADGKPAGSRSYSTREPIKLNLRGSGQ